MKTILLVGFTKPKNPKVKEPLPEGFVAMSLGEALRPDGFKFNGGLEVFIHSGVGNAKANEVRRNLRNPPTSVVRDLDDLERQLRESCDQIGIPNLVARFREDPSGQPRISDEVLMTIPDYSPIASRDKSTWKPVRHTGGWHQYAYPGKRASR